MAIRGRSAALLLAGTVIGSAIGAAIARATPESASPYRNLSTFARVLAHIETSYVEEPDQDALVYGAVRGMVDTLDPHSSFMDPEEFQVLSSDTQGRFGGIGVEIDVQDGFLTVVATFEGGPAARAGIEPGDRFLLIETLDARDIRVEDAIRRMRGEPGTQVRVRIRRATDGRQLDLTLTREIIQVRSVEARLLPDRIVHVELKAFQESTTRELRRAIDLAVAQAAPLGGLRGVLLDMRNNAGGLLDEAVLVSDEFIEQGVIVSTRGRGGQLLAQSEAEARGTRPNWPMVVLVNGYTASAAEIVAGALRDHRRAVIVGTRTFGKGSVQNVIELPDGSGLKLTIARYYTPSGRSIQAQGIEPDIVVEQLDLESLREGQAPPIEIREETLEGHLPAETTQPDDAGPPPPRQSLRTVALGGTQGSEHFPDDYQALMAYQTLRALVVLRER